MKKKNKLISTLLIGTCLLSLASCGSDDDDSSADTSVQQQQQEDEGLYRVNLSPLNGSSASGIVKIRIEGDDVVVESNVSGVASGVKHLQNLTFGTSCPSSSNDVNGDSYVDVLESVTSTGPILIPLDSNLSDQLAGMSYGPIANSSGSYVYRRSTSLSRMLSDLQSPDPDLVDAVVKLPEGQNLNLAGRVVVVHGVGSSANLPDSVSTLDNFTAEQSLPVACGQIVRMTSEDEFNAPAPTPAPAPEPTPEPTPVPSPEPTNGEAPVEETF